jgi:hypothetical protein
MLINLKLKSLISCTYRNFGIPIQFLPLGGTNSTKLLYHESISILEELKYKKKLSDKIEILSQCREKTLYRMREYRYLYRKSQRESEDKKQEEMDLEWHPDAEDSISVFTYIFSKASIMNHTAQFQFINDWKTDGIMMDPVSHMIPFYEGFLSYIRELDPSVSDRDGILISNFTISRELEQSIEHEIRNNNSVERSTFLLIPSILLFVSLQVGMRCGKEIQQLEMSIDDHEDLVTKLLHHRTALSSIFGRSELIGFTLSFNEENNIIIIHLSRVYPEHVYSELALAMTKLIQFDSLDSLFDKYSSSSGNREYSIIVSGS